MASSDRTQFKQVVAGSISDLRTLAVTNPLQSNGCVAQDAQRYLPLNLTAGTAINAAANYSLARLDRQVVIKELRLLPSAALTTSGNTTFVLGFTNDGGGTFSNIAVFNTNQNTSLGTGNFAQWVSVNCMGLAGATVTANNQLVPQGAHLVLKQIPTTPSEALPAGTAFQVIWEEV